jgi:hypothetical protein
MGSHRPVLATNDGWFGDISVTHRSDSMSLLQGRAHVFMCKRLANDQIVIDRYINPSGHQYPEPAEADAGGLMTPGEQQFHDGLVICRFNLSNFTDSTPFPPSSILPLSPSTEYHPIFAVGILDSDSKRATTERCSIVFLPFQTNHRNIIRIRVLLSRTWCNSIRTQ